MTTFSYLLQVFLQVVFAQIILSSDIFQLTYDDLQTLLVNSRNSKSFQTLEDVLARDGAFVSTRSNDSQFPFLRNLISTLLLPYTKKRPVILEILCRLYRGCRLTTSGL